MKKIYIIAILIILLITGCGKNYKRADVKEYIDKEIGIKNYTLANNYEEKIDNEEFTDKLWKVKYKDLEFYVIDDHYYASEYAYNKLIDNYTSAVLEHYYKTNNTYYLDDIYASSDHYKNKYILCEVRTNSDKTKNETDVKKCYEEIKLFINSIDFKEYPIKEINFYFIDASDKNPIELKTVYENNAFISYEEFSN